METTNTLRWTSSQAVWAAMAALILALALAGPQAAFAEDKKGKDGKVPIVIKKPIVTQDPPKKK